VFATFSRRFGRIALGAAILPAALAAAGAAPAPDRDGWGRGRDHDDRWEHRGSDRSHFGINVGVVLGQPVRREVIVRQPPVVISQPAPVIISQPVVVRTYSDVAPSQIGFQAYQSRDTVILVVNGTNFGAGYSTSLTAADCAGWTPTVIMRNTPTCETDRSYSTPFSISASLRVTHSVSSVRVTLAGQTYEVPVVEAPSLS
jgi:hypothetical protein